MAKKLMISIAGVVVLVGLVAPPVNGGVPLDGYKGAATAVVVRVFPSFPALTIADPPAQADAPHTTVTLASGPTGFARSSILWPGDILAHMGSLLTQVDPRATAVPNYPVVAEAQSPGGKSHQDVGGGAAIMDALADGNLAEASGWLASAGPAGAFSVLGVFSTSRAEFKGETVVSSTEAVVHGLDIMDGLITADEVRTVAAASSDGTKGIGDGATTVTGLRVNGQEAAIDGNGIHAADQGTDIPNPSDPITAALAASGIRIQIASPVQTVEGAGVNRVHAGLLIRIPLPEGVAQIKGASMTIAIASANVAANASRGPNAALENGDVALPRDGDDLDFPEAPSSSGIPDFPADSSIGGPAAVTPVTEVPDLASGVLPISAEDLDYSYGGISWIALVTTLIVALYVSSRVRRWLAPFLP